MIRTTFKIFSRTSKNRPNLLLLVSKFLGFIDPLNLGTLIQKKRVRQGHARFLHFRNSVFPAPIADQSSRDPKLNQQLSPSSTHSINSICAQAHLRLQRLHESH